MPPLLLLALLATVVAAARADVARSLSPWQQLQHAFHMETSSEFELVDLAPETKYQLRVSYPASTPAQFRFQVHAAYEIVDNLPLAAHSSHHRRLLNTAMAELSECDFTEPATKLVTITALSDSHPPFAGPVHAIVTLVPMLTVLGASLPADALQLLPGVAVIMCLALVAFFNAGRLIRWVSKAAVRTE